MIIGIILLYITLSFLYFFYWVKKDRDEGIYRLSIVLFMPVFGFLYFFILYLFNRFFDNSKNAIDTKLESTKQSEIFTVQKKPDIAKEVNIVPVEEALILNDSHIKRKLLIDVLKKDALEYIKFLKKALNDSDTETSHYAAAAVTEVKRKLSLSLQTFSEKYETYKNSIEKMITCRDDMENHPEYKFLTDILLSYTDVLEKYLNSGLLDELNQTKYGEVYCTILKKLLQVYTSEEKYFIDIINYYIQIENFDEAKEYCTKFHDTHHNSEKAYIMGLKLFYHTHDYKNFTRTLNELKESHIRLSNSSLNIIRFWSQGSEGG